MNVNTNIARFQPPGFLQPQAPLRPQAEQDRPQQTPLAVKKTQPLPGVPDQEAYEQLRQRTRGPQADLEREGLGSRARKAISAYDSVERSESRDYATRVLGIDLYV